MYTGSKPRRQSDKLLATICASFRLARVQADGGTVGACGHEVDTKRDERSTGVFLGEHLRSELLDGRAEDLLGLGVESEVRRPIRQDIVYLNLAKPRLVDLSCGGRQAPTAAIGAPTLAAPPPPPEAEMSCHSPLEKRRIAALPRQPQKYCYQMLRQCSGIQ